MTAPTFPKQDPAAPEFWNQRFDAAFTPWDQGSVPQSLQTWAREFTAAVPPRVLIPGCGSAWEVRFLLELGWDITAIDFSAAAVAQAQLLLGVQGAHVYEADFFNSDLLQKQFDVIYERAFLCALPRRLWRQWSARIAELIVPGGYLAGFFFSDESPKGPPFGLQPGELEALLEVHFKRRQMHIPADSVPVFAGKESWQVWERIA